MSLNSCFDQSRPLTSTSSSGTCWLADSERSKGTVLLVSLNVDPGSGGVPSKIDESPLKGDTPPINQPGVYESGCARLPF